MDTRYIGRRQMHLTQHECERTPERELTILRTALDVEWKHEKNDPQRDGCASNRSKASRLP